MIWRRRGSEVEVKLHQFCNDWISVDGPDGDPKILNPVSVVVSLGELEEMRRSVNPGHFWDWYDSVPCETATSYGFRFKKIRR